MSRPRSLGNYRYSPSCTTTNPILRARRAMIFNQVFECEQELKLKQVPGNESKLSGK